MPKKRTTREKFKRQIEQSINHYTNIETTLSNMFIIYNETHPEIGVQLAILLEANDALREALKKFSKSF